MVTKGVALGGGELVSLGGKIEGLGGGEASPLHPPVDETLTQSLHNSVASSKGKLRLHIQTQQKKNYVVSHNFLRVGSSLTKLTCFDMRLQYYTITSKPAIPT